LQAKPPSIEELVKQDIVEISEIGKMSKISPAPKTSKTIDANQVVKEIRKTTQPERVSELARYFKTTMGQYGAGDLFLGSTVPSIRGVAKLYPDLSIP